MSSDLPRPVHQMSSYAAYHLSEQATGGRQLSEATVRANLRATYPRADESDIDAALQFGRQSVRASEEFRDRPEGTTLGEATGIPDDTTVIVYFRLRWGEGEDAQYRIFPVRSAGRRELSTLGDAARALAASFGEEQDYPLGKPDETQLFKVDFFPPPE